MDIMAIGESIGLPDDYVFVDDTEMQIDEIMALRQLVGWDADTQERWIDCLDSQSFFLGVRYEEGVGDLVGMARLAGDVRHSVICDGVVHPNHQRKGIGKAMLKEIIEYADQNGVTYLYTDLAEDNPLRPTFDQLGFMDTGNSLFRKHP